MKVVQVLVILSCIYSLASSAAVQLGTCYLAGTAADSGITGTVVFTQQTTTTVKVDVTVTGITVGTGAEHGLHVHQFGDITATDGTAAAGHWNPAAVAHNCPDNPTRHVGDMGNWTVSAGGAITQTKTLDLLTLTGGANSILGRAVILHTTFDDCTGTVGNAGGRLAQCVIGVATPAINTDTNTAAATPGVTHAICDLRPTTGNTVAGTVMLVQTDPEGPTRVMAHITGMDGNPHAFHIHEFGDVSSATGGGAGGHYNPLSMHHAIPPFPVRHVGDMGNIVYYDLNGDAWYDYTNDMISLNGEYSVVGRAVIVHATFDDCTPTVGNAGSRYAQCVIGVMNATKTVIDVPTATPTTQDSTPCNDLYTLPATATDEGSGASTRSIILALVAALAAFCAFLL